MTTDYAIKSALAKMSFKVDGTVQEFIFSLNDAQKSSLLTIAGNCKALEVQTEKDSTELVVIMHYGERPSSARRITLDGEIKWSMWDAMVIDLTDDLSTSN